MHFGNKVFITPNGNLYHYTDDDCPVVSKMYRTKNYMRMTTEKKAKAQGRKLCKHCKKEYHEDQMDILAAPFKFLKRFK